MISGLIFPYIHSPYRNFELFNAFKLQNLYNQGELNFDFTNISSNTNKQILLNQSNNITLNLTNSLPSFE